jgi:hypothetical protein
MDDFAQNPEAQKLAQMLQEQQTQIQELQARLEILENK